MLTSSTTCSLKWLPLYRGPIPGRRKFYTRSLMQPTISSCSGCSSWQQRNGFCSVPLPAWGSGLSERLLRYMRSWGDPARRGWLLAPSVRGRLQGQVAGSYGGYRSQGRSGRRDQQRRHTGFRTHSCRSCQDQEAGPELWSFPEYVSACSSVGEVRGLGGQGSARSIPFIPGYDLKIRSLLGLG